MSVFRPSARVVDPDRREWELYAYRIRLPARGRRRGLRTLRHLVWDAPRAGLRALRSDEWTIEAITWDPHRTSYAWRTTGELRGHVLAQVEGQLTRGEVPRVRHATYLGSTG